MASYKIKSNAYGNGLEDIQPIKNRGRPQYEEFENFDYGSKNKRENSNNSAESVLQKVKNQDYKIRNQQRIHRDKENQKFLKRKNYGKVINMIAKKETTTPARQYFQVQSEFVSKAPQQPKLKQKLLKQHNPPQIEISRKPEQKQFQMVNKDTFGKLPSIDYNKQSTATFLD